MKIAPLGTEEEWYDNLIVCTFLSQLIVKLFHKDAFARAWLSSNPEKTASTFKPRFDSSLFIPQPTECLWVRQCYFFEAFTGVAKLKASDAI